MDQYSDFAEAYDTTLAFPHGGHFRKKLFKLIRNLVEDSEPHSILDVACGTGTMLSTLDGEYDCVGIDLSPAMLNVAHGKIHRGMLVQADMRNFELSKNFGLIICLFDSVNHLIEDAEIRCFFNSVANHLTANGLFVFDVYTEAGLIRNTQTEDPQINVEKTSSGYTWTVKINEKCINIYERSLSVNTVRKLLPSCLSINKILNENLEHDISEANRLVFICGLSENNV